MEEVWKCYGRGTEELWKSYGRGVEMNAETSVSIFFIGTIVLMVYQSLYVCIAYYIILSSAIKLKYYYNSIPML